MNDLSGDDVGQGFPVADLRLQLAQQQLRHRESLFSIAVASGVLMYITFAVYLFSVQDKLEHNRLIALGILAAMPASVMLGLMRFVFRKEKDHDDSGAVDISPLLCSPPSSR